MKASSFLLFAAIMLNTSCGLQTRFLEWIPSQQVIVKSAKLGWRTAFRTMLNELAPQSSEGDYIRPTPQRGSDNAPILNRNKQYQLYVGNACPWCHRTTLGLALRGFPSNIGVTELEDDPERASRGGWIVKSGIDPIFGMPDLKQIYDKAFPQANYGRATAPLLIEVNSKTAISSESGDILRAICQMQTSERNQVNLRPTHLISEIDKLNLLIYEANDGVYRCGFASTQTAYDRAERNLHSALQQLESTLAASSHRFLLGDKVTESDLRLFPTISRFDACYATLFRCGRKLINSHYPNLSKWRVNLALLPGVSDTIDVAAAARSYYSSLFPLNPSGIIPAPPEQVPLPLSSSSISTEIDAADGDLVEAGLAFSFSSSSSSSSSSSE
mmetsp:Transcript_15257/g.22915  ORF Transcript_15257/g.22915 Transcript_15257/m.22915 type:complete len:386 (-) Transcript_15257:103-1260(-)